MRWLAVLVVVVLTGAAEAQEQLERALLAMPPIIGAPTAYRRNGKESIYRIARRFGVSPNAVYNANNGSLTDGDELLLLPTQHVAPLAEWSGIVVNLPERNLYLYQEGRPIRCYPVAIGQRGWETPVGEFKIANKRKNPTWFPPKWALQEQPVPPGPGNPLGDRWMGLSIPGYGIHATNAPATVGRYVSHGCLRMYPEHAHELYRLTPVGAPAKIMYERTVLGYRPEDGVVYLAYYPDPYQVAEVKPEQVREQLKDYGLADMVDGEGLAEILRRPTGVLTPIVGSRAKVRVNGTLVKSALGPTWAGGDWLVPAGPMARALGAQVEVGPGVNYLIIMRGEERLFLSPGDAQALVNGEMVTLETAPQLAAGYPMIPLRATVTALGASLGWDEESQTLLVWDGVERLRGGLASVP